MLRLAAPLALAELGWMAMGIVDTIMAARSAPAAVGAGILGQHGLLPAGDELHRAAARHGHAGRAGVRREATCRTPPHAGQRRLAGARAHAGHGRADHGGDPADARPSAPIRDVMAQCDPYMRALAWGMLPLFLFTAFRRYLQALNIVKAGDVHAGQREPHQLRRATGC